MNFNEKLAKLSYLHELIKHKATGNPDQLAEKMGVSKRTAQNYIKHLRQMGAPITYCHLSVSYCYSTCWENASLEIVHQ